MQLYKHADIMTAKATKEERAQAKHHMIDLIELEELGFNRNMYYDFSKIVFDRLHDEGKCPVIVGGTNYYIETLLFKN
jgi:tRNA dimethylallyltransferase